MGTTLQFRGTNFRDLIEILAEAAKLADAGEQPAVQVNTVIYSPGDLGALAALVPEGTLSKRHHAFVDAVLIDRRKPVDDYRKAAVILAQRADDGVARHRGATARSASRR
jgi:hypothetical protein